MAGSRYDRIGTIFSRTTGLLKSGAMKYQDRPVWYDIYRVFPPKYEPHIDREPSISVEQVPNILYKEDKVRAQFFKAAGLNPDGRPRRLGDPSYEDPSSTFVAKFNEVQTSHPNWSSEHVFETVSEEYLSSRPQYQKQQRLEGDEGQGGSVDVHTRSSGVTGVDDEEDRDEGLGERVGPKKMTLVTPESLRALFEEAKSNQNQGPGEDSKGGKSGDK